MTESPTSLCKVMFEKKLDWELLELNATIQTINDANDMKKHLDRLWRRAAGMARPSMKEFWRRSSLFFWPVFKLRWFSAQTVLRTVWAFFGFFLPQIPSEQGWERGPVTTLRLENRVLEGGSSSLALQDNGASLVSAWASPELLYTRAEPL